MKKTWSKALTISHRSTLPDKNSSEIFIKMKETNIKQQDTTNVWYREYIAIVLVEV